MESEARQDVACVKPNIRATRIWKHCPRRVYSCARQALQVVLADRLRLGRGRPDATELRAHEETD